MGTTRNHTARGPGCLVDASTLQCCGAQATFAQEQPHAAEYYLDEESTVKEVQVVSTRYDQGAFPVLLTSILINYY